MRFFLEQKIGQSGNELVLSVFLSFFLHAALVIIALILYTTVSPKVYVPPVYDVKLVGQPAMIAPASAPPSAPTSAPPVAKPAPAPVEKKPEPKPKTAAIKPEIKTLKKGDMPELSLKKTKPARDEVMKPARTEHVKPAAPERARPAPKETATTPNASSEGAAPSAGTTAGIAVNAVNSASGDSRQLSSYADIIRNSIERNWSPPPGAKGMKAKVSFKVLRTGRLFGDVNIEESSGNTYFDMAAKRAILASSPFPSMPEEFYKQYAEFSVDVQEKN
jgi:colicin import membrane protein